MGDKCESCGILVSVSSHMLVLRSFNSVFLLRLKMEINTRIWAGTLLFLRLWTRHLCDMLSKAPDTSRNSAVATLP